MSTILPTPQEVCTAGLFAIENTLGEIKFWLNCYPERSFETMTAPRRKSKEALRLDIDAEDSFIRNLNKDYKEGLFQDILVYGEESIDESTDFSGETGIIALVDMIDGTDLLERNLSNWCSAAVFFRPSAEEGKQILASCVGFPSGRIYYAYANSDGVYYNSTEEGEEVRVGGLSPIKELRQASISFYGQKVSSLYETMKTGLIDYLLAEPQVPETKNQNKANHQKRKNRIYTLAGIPMIVKLIDHRIKQAANIDVVFDCNGQRPHDFIAGAYLAKKANAVIKNIDSGNEISYADLERALLRPDNPQSDFRYVVAVTEDLCDEILPLLKKSLPQSTKK